MDAGAAPGYPLLAGGADFGHRRCGRRTVPVGLAVLALTVLLPAFVPDGLRVRTSDFVNDRPTVPIESTVPYGTTRGPGRYWAFAAAALLIAVGLIGAIISPARDRPSHRPLILR